ncbi:hypothetical protein PPL_05404 [Heterostelium album PN500]|uniref:Uncharacterized protein n=1 Tax=Heterostelium pallidum (strain ATCC 26659 / Pp 5 / PN500) TaxID=670386 RepID=D3BA31_HETP5|nr:hypothetical protein PPL_05404 [Heterostelium album PN500]EFA81418.1 hypothetical protein PPL_05404 [Heterostelium album PN500]|eukprot:XP_020433536.1 hypothetical protein PPL_05404 [Heterostelium album PN500]
MDNNNNIIQRDITFLFKKVFNNKILYKNIFAKVRDVNSRYIWGTNHLVQPKSIFASGIHSFPGEMYSNKNFRMLESAEWMLKNNYINALFYKLKMFLERYHTEHKLTWSTEALNLAAQKIRDESLIEYLTDSTSDYTLHLLEAAVRFDNLILFQKLTIVGAKKLLKFNSIPNLFELAVECGKVEIVKFIAKKYSPIIDNHDRLFEKALSSRNRDTILKIARSSYYKPKEKTDVMRILFLNHLGVAEFFLDSISPLDMEKEMNIYETNLININVDHFTWSHFDIMVYLCIKKFSGTLDIDDINAMLYLTRNVNPHNLSDNQMAFYSLVLLLQKINSPNLPHTLNQLVTFRNSTFIHAIIDSNIFSKTNLKQTIIKQLIGYGMISLIMEFIDYIPDTLPSIKVLSKDDTLEILTLIKSNLPNTKIEYEVLMEEARRGNATTVDYIIRNFPPIPNQNNSVIFTGALIRGQMDLVYLGLSHGIHGLTNEFFHTAKNFLQLYKMYGKENLLITERHIKNMVIMHLKEEFELAVQEYRILVDPIVFVYLGDFDWMVEAIEKHQCKPKTDDNYKHLHFELQKQIGTSGSIKLYRMYEYVMDKNNQQWRKSILDEANKYNHSKLLKAIKLNIDEF